MDITNESYSYESVGLNGFLQRDLGSSSISTPAQKNTVNYDQAAVSGALGDTFQVGKVNIDGARGGIYVHDDNGNEIGAVGEF